MKPSIGVVFAAFFLAASTGLFAADGAPPRFDHIVVVIEENHSLAQVGEASYLASLASRGTLFTRSYAVAHPSQPNYIALFSGSTRGISDDGPHDIQGPNLASSLEAAGLTFTGYAEELPREGFRGSRFRDYVRKHTPWVSFTNLPARINKPFSDFPADFDKLPTVSFVIPDLMHDMHDGSVAEGDRWLQENMDRYARWAVSHNSLLVVTFDEGPGSHPLDETPIATILVGARVHVGASDQPITHYSVLRLIEDVYGLPYLAEDRSAARITGIWD